MTHDPHNDDFGSIPISNTSPAEEGERPQEPPKTEPKKSRRTKRSKHRLPSSSRRWPHWLLAILLLGTTLFFGGGYVLIPYLTTTLLADHLSQKLQRPVTIANAEFDPLSLRLTVRNSIIGSRLDLPDDPVDPVLSLGSATVDFDIRGLISGRLICQSLTADSLFIHLVRSKKGSYNFDTIRQTLISDTERDYSLNNIALTNSRLRFDDQASGKRHSLEEINLALPALSNISYKGGQYIKPKFSAKINGSPMNLTGETSVQGETLTAKLAVHLDDIDLPRYAAYLPADLALPVDKGQATFDGSLILSFGPKKATQLELEGTAKLKNISFSDQEKNRNRISSASLTGRIAPFARTYHFDNVQLAGADLAFDHTPKGGWALPWLSGRHKEKQAARQDKNIVTIAKLVASSGKIRLTDRMVKGGFSSDWQNVQFSLKNFDSRQDAPASFALSGKDKKGSRFSAQGDLFAAPLRASGLLVVNDLELSRLSPYFKAGNKLHVTSGTVSRLDGQFNFGSQKDGKATKRLDKLGLTIKNLTLKREGTTWAKLPRLSVKNAELDLAARSLRLGNLSLNGGSLLCRWDENKKFNWQPPHTEKNKNSSWKIDYKKIEVKKTDLTLRYQPYPKVTQSHVLKDLALSLTEHSASGQADLRDGGSVQIKADLNLNPFSATVDTILKNIPASGLASLINPWLNPELTAGSFNIKGVFTLPKMSFTGSLEASNILTGRGNVPLARITTAKAQGLNFTSQPFALSIEGISLKGPHLYWTQKSKGSSLTPFLKPPADRPAKKLGKTPFSVGTIRIENGKLSFSDQRLGRPFSTTLTDIKGNFSKIAALPGNRAEFDMTAAMGDATTIGLKGDVGLFDSQMPFTASLQLTHGKLTTFAPYAETVLGYSVTGGSLNLQAELIKSENRLSQQTTLQLKNMGLGKRTKGTTGLPFTLALITDVQGELTQSINTKTTSPLPIVNSLKKHFRGLSAKAAVAPFSLVKKSLPTLHLKDHLQFSPAQHSLNEEEQDLLQRLAAALKNRPALAIILTGFADDVADRNGLLVKLREAEEQKRKAHEAQLSAALSQSYGKEEIQRPSSGVSAPPVYEETIFDASSVSKKELLRLATARALYVQKELVNTHNIAENRIRLGVGTLLSAQSPLTPRSRVGVSFELLK